MEAQIMQFPTPARKDDSASYFGTYRTAGLAHGAADAATERTGIKHRMVQIPPRSYGEAWTYSVAPVGVAPAREMA